MPQSNTWQGVAGLESKSGVDSPGSCDSVVSANSCRSDDSLEYLSAEEKACLLFLEETIESLDVDDSALCTDELPNPGNLSSKLADLSASLNKNKPGSQDRPPIESIKRNVEGKLLHSYLVPTPFMVASGAHRSVASADMAKPRVTFKDSKPDHKPKAPPVALEVNVVTAPPTKPKGCPGTTADALLPRGPLSYEALVHLRKSASAKKTPLCPTVDHTIESDQQRPLQMRTLKSGNLSTSDKYSSKPPKSNVSPPAVPPKTKIPPPNVPAKALKGSTASNSFYNLKNAQDPKWARQEALQKLGLLQEDEPAAMMAPPPDKPPSTFSSTSSKFTRGAFNGHPSRSPSFCHPQVPTEAKNRALQSSASFHCCSRTEQQPLTDSKPAQPNRVRKAAMERSAPGEGHRSRGNFTEHSAPPTMVQAHSATQDEVRKPPSSQVGYTAMVVPGMGADRKEALRKLGLLKN